MKSIALALLVALGAAACAQQPTAPAPEPGSMAGDGVIGSQAPADTTATPGTTTFNARKKGMGTE